ncbi:unnamed protein product [Penicillium nalgiovense]|uniref:gamma-glutamylcyclotransferase n=1 Tax=Penicillium nalgiovense TaxID=60175 RepID=A0A9W4HDY7_PENNA|nr:unnamed protein product [Penicillium nalgiovense]CAG7993336.1 unnamed protein product [Penicillium nalgiovense]CAG8008856.1 unnamed protein product [Penicillium nalgiovense]CAG8014745.1 unnamed protein product [Penicillium nalgiovense]CAG8029366.1 unnamed protein product [Penicillium nalgiovense]
MTQQAPHAEDAPASRFRFNATQPLDRLQAALAKPAKVELETDPIPRTNVARRRASSVAASLEQDKTLPEKISEQQEHGIGVLGTVARDETVLYLAYGSNLASKTFRGVRGIKPLSQICVLVPELRLTFDLPGIPYAEPCFAGTQYRDVSPPADNETGLQDDERDVSDSKPLSEKAALISRTRQVEEIPDCDKRQWHKPLVGVVYEVTLADYAKIIATEGGGRGYRDCVIDCHPFHQSYDPSDPVPDYPTTPAFKARTLLSPAADDDRFRSQSQKGNALLGGGPQLSWWYTICLHFRPDPNYAQPSARYLGLIKTGAAEHDLPVSYREYLAQVKTYHITTTRQKIGKAIFLALWAPLLILTLMLSRIFAGPDGRMPPWLVALANIVFSSVWNSYDCFFAPVFGDGERTLDDTRA